MTGHRTSSRAFQTAATSPCEGLCEEPVCAMSVSVIIKWGGQEYSISSLSEEDTVMDLKQSIKTLTGVLPERQKLLGLKLKGEMGWRRSRSSHRVVECLNKILKIMFYHTLAKFLKICTSSFVLPGKPAEDEVKLGTLKLKPNTKIMMMGTREESLVGCYLPQQHLAQKYVMCSWSVSEQGTLLLVDKWGLLSLCC